MQVQIRTNQISLINLFLLIKIKESHELRVITLSEEVTTLVVWIPLSTKKKLRMHGEMRTKISISRSKVLTSNKLKRAITER